MEKSVFTPETVGLGRIRKEDARDKNFPMRQLLQMPKSPAKRRAAWGERWAGNQGNTPRCVGYGWAHYIEDDPVIHAGITHPVVSPDLIYTNAQQLDGMPLPHDGSTVRAGAEFLKNIGYIASYHWAQSLQDIIDCVLNLGPVVMGTDWYTDMFFPDAKKGYMVKIGGVVEGGHCWKLDAVDLYYQGFGGKNSWGQGWGKNGHFFISFADVKKLLEDGGEACLAIELPKSGTYVDPNQAPTPAIVPFGTQTK